MKKKYICFNFLYLKHWRPKLQQGPANGHLDTGFAWFPCVYKQMLRWFPRFQVATPCSSCSPPDLNLLGGRKGSWGCLRTWCLWIFGPRKDEVTGEWRRPHNEELTDLYSSPNIVRVIKSRRMRWAGHVARIGEERGVYRVLLGKPEWRRPLGRPRRRWVDNIRMDLQEVACGYMDWIGLAQDRESWRTLVSAVMNFRVPWNAGNFLTSYKPVSFSRRTLHHGVSK